MRLLASKWRGRLGVILTLAIIATLVALPGFAAVTSVSGVFESNDGNLAVDNGSAAVDWNSFTSSSVATAWNFHQGTDPVNGSGDDIFAGGTKQDDECPSIVPDSGGGANTKTDITRFYVANKLISVGGQDHEFLSLAWERIPQSSVSSSSFVGFEFYKNSTSCGTGSPMIHRTPGDMLVVYNFEGGTADSVVKLSRWLTKLNGDSNTDCELGIQASKFVGCWGKTQTLTATGFADGKVNNGGSVTDALQNSTLGIVEFGEAGIDLTAAGVFPEGTCTAFGKGDAVSRTSGNSAQAQNKDLIAPINVNITNCGAIRIEKQDGQGNALLGSTFSVYKDNPTVGAFDSGSDTLFAYPNPTTINQTGGITAAATSITVADGTKLPLTGPYYVKIGSEFIRVASRSGNVLTVASGGRGANNSTAATHANAVTVARVAVCDPTGDPAQCTLGELPFGKYAIVETVTPNGYVTAAPQFADLTASSTVPYDVVFTNNPSPVDITIHKRDGSGNAVAICTATITTDCASFKLFQKGAESTLSGNITKTATSLSVADGSAFPASSFEVVIGKEIVGVTSNASNSFTGLTRGVEGSDAAAHTSGATVTSLGNSVNCVPANDTQAAAGNCVFSSIVPGNYIIVETVHPAGRGKDSDLPQFITVQVGDAASAHIYTYDNPPLYKVITVVCAKVDNQLYSSKVSYDNDALPNDPNSPTSLAGVNDETAFCRDNTGGSTHDNVGAGAHTGNVSIP